jgi:hypothetical protein
VNDQPAFQGPETFADHVAGCWTEALGVWGTGIELSPPDRWVKGAGGAWNGDEPLAYIDLVQRQVVVNFDKLHAIGAFPSLPAVLAHEIGHHIAFPHTLGLAAALEILQHRLLPYPHSLTNLFFDLQVNEYVGRTHAVQLADVYKGFGTTPQTTPLFGFYLAVYEELWGLAELELVGAAGTRLDAEYPGWRAEARMFSQTFYSLPDVYLQFVYFCSIFARYLDQSAAPEKGPMGSDAQQPEADDYAGALYGNSQVDRALDEAEARGWLERADAEKAKATDPMTTINKIGGGKPGTEIKAFRRGLVSGHYRRLVDEHLFEVPPSPDTRVPDPMIPTTTEDWEWGDSPTAIDWTATVLASGPLALLNPLKRTLEAADPDMQGRGLPAIEIYLDTSGSMPDPTQTVNAMTLAAQILAAAALRRNGMVRAIIYSYGPPMVSDWMYDEATARDYLLNYAGGGTDYPFDLLVRHATERPGAIRVVISDSDFLSNLAAAGALAKLMIGVEKSQRLVTLLSLYAAPPPPLSTIAHPAFRLVRITSPKDFAHAASDLARALFGDSR